MAECLGVFLFLKRLIFRSTVLLEYQLPRSLDFLEVLMYKVGRILTPSHMYITDRPVCALVEHIAISAVGHGHDSGAVKSNSVSPTARHRWDVSLELFAQELSRGDGPRHWLRA